MKPVHNLVQPQCKLTRRIEGLLAFRDIYFQILLMEKTVDLTELKDGASRSPFVLNIHGGSRRRCFIEMVSRNTRIFENDLCWTNDYYNTTSSGIIFKDDQILRQPIVCRASKRRRS